MIEITELKIGITHLRENKNKKAIIKKVLVKF